MKCQRCNSERVAQISAKCDDMFYQTIKGKEMNGYVPLDMGIGGGDYLEFKYCLDCGQIQGTFPLSLTEEEDS
jgi:hypothetical protein